MQLFRIVWLTATTLAATSHATWEASGDFEYYLSDDSNTFEGFEISCLSMLEFDGLSMLKTC